MRRFTVSLLAVLAALSAASAAPLLGTGASVYTSDLCRAQACRLVARDVVAPDLLDGVSYTYRLRGGAQLLVVRSNTGAVQTVALGGSRAGQVGQLGQAVARAVTGRTFEAATLRRCHDQATARGFEAARGVAAGVPYTLTCYRLPAGTYTYIDVLPPEGGPPA